MSDLTPPIALTAAIDETVVVGDQRGLIAECLAFGARLIETQDLDPVYTCLVGAALPEPQMCRLLLAYACFYHLGAAAWLSEHKGGDYWQWMTDAAANEYLAPPSGTRWPRSAERRHFRGPKCVEAVRRLAEETPESRVRRLAALSSEREIIAEVRRWYLFGAWVAFKMADLMERVYGAPIAFSADTILLYDEPRRSLEALQRERVDAYDVLLRHFAAWRAPPTFDRPCGPAEVETLLCKFASYNNDRYWIGKDISEVSHGLVGWGRTSEKLLASAPIKIVRGSDEKRSLRYPKYSK